MGTGAFWVYILPIIFTLVLLVFWRTCTEQYPGCYESNFPTKFHIVLFFLLSLIPIVGIISFCALLAIYIANRIIDVLRIKKNKFTKFWFDLKDDD